MLSIDISSYPPRSVVFGTFGAVHPRIKVSRERKLLGVLEYYRRVKDSGFRWMISRYSNPKGLESHRRIGTRLIKEAVL
jgi:hypothetical protein